MGWAARGCVLASLLAAIQQTKAALAPSYDCSHGSPSTWLAEKTAWCTAHRGASKFEPYDCSAGYTSGLRSSEDWRNGWSAGKKTWCCEHKDRGCPSELLSSSRRTTTTDAAARAAKSAPSSSTAAAGSSSAGETRLRGAPGGGGGGSESSAAKGSDAVTRRFSQPESGSPPGSLYDCESDYGNWEVAWSDMKQAYCCEYEHRGCDHSEGERPARNTHPEGAPSGFTPFNCTPNTSDWKQRWSESKKSWCCEKEKVGCSERTTQRAPTYGVPVTYDCKQGSSVFWSDEKSKWCCQRNEAFCTTTTNTSSTSTSTTSTKSSSKTSTATGTKTSTTRTTTTLPYNCSSGLTNWKQGWSSLKKSWCCDHTATGCLEAATRAPPYDCSRGMRWSAGKKAWCCLNEGRMCPSTSVAEPNVNNSPVRTTPVTPAVVRATYSAGDSALSGRGGPPVTSAAVCDSLCDYGGMNATCRLRIQSAATHRYKESPNACHKAWKVVVDACPTCEVCSPDGADCIEHPMSFDCKAGLANWVEEWSEKKKFWCCAHKQLGCGEAGSPSPSPKARSLPYLCGAGLENWEKGWSYDKKRYCCETMRLGCSSGMPQSTTLTRTTTATTVVFNCKAGAANAEKGWSAVKKRWCCEMANVHCPVTTTTMKPPYDCKAEVFGAAKVWSSEKQEWCCSHQRLGCHSKTTTTTGTRSNSTTSTSTSTRTTSARTNTTSTSTTTTSSSTATNTTSSSTSTYSGTTTSTTTTGVTNRTGSLPYDCRAGLANWENGWSDTKKEWCCNHTQLGCGTTTTSSSTTSTSYDCKAGFATWVQAWSESKKHWCCMMMALGCPVKSTTHSTGTGKPQAQERLPARPGHPASPEDVDFDCDAGLSHWEVGWSTMKQDWCCDHERKGCMNGTASSDGGAARESSQLGTTSLLFDCDAGYSHWSSGWSAAKQAWCCEVSGRGCTSTTTPCPFRCEAGLEEWERGWSPQKKVWCCENKGLGCRRAHLGSSGGSQGAAPGTAARGAAAAGVGQRLYQDQGVERLSPVQRALRRVSRTQAVLLGAGFGCLAIGSVVLMARRPAAARAAYTLIPEQRCQE